LEFLDCLNICAAVWMSINNVVYILADPSGRAAQVVGLRPLAWWVCAFESHPGAWMSVLYGVCVVW
jgi:hypothetical protein